MKAKIIKRVQQLYTNIETAWDFFSSPLNLAEITPPWLNFRVMSEVPEKMYEGLIIEYRVHPFFGLPVSWVTEITHADEPNYFVDRQISGPYALWHHEHHFSENENGVTMTDLVHYIPRLEPLGSLLLGGIIRRKLNEIFDYRFSVLEKKFGRTLS